MGVALFAEFKTHAASSLEKGAQPCRTKERCEFEDIFVAAEYTILVYDLRRADAGAPRKSHNVIRKQRDFSRRLRLFPPG